ncbi:MAG: glycosyltransferase family 39 protein [Planctomycetota bacterium]
MNERHVVAGKRVSRWRATALIVFFVVVCVFPLFWSLGDHAVHGDSEARYGVVARAMVAGDSPWLVPHYFGEPHLTKPPLTYWLMAASIACVGDGELALRLPSAVAACLTMAVVFGLAAYRGGWRRGVVAAGLLAVTPMFLAVSRMGLTDAPLNLLSTAGLAAGYLGVKENKQKYIWILWICVAGAFFTKGPVGLLVPGALCLWVAAGGAVDRREGWRRLRLGRGLAVAALPLVGWGAAVAWVHPEAWGVWRFQVMDRAVGTGDHPEPWWFFVPVLLVGLFPATALLDLKPLKKLTIKNMNFVQSDSDAGLWSVMVLVTFIVFTVISGKLMTYLLPLSAPMVWLASAPMVRRVFGSLGRPGLSAQAEWNALTPPLLIVALGTAAAGGWLIWWDGVGLAVEALWPMAGVLGAGIWVMASRSRRRWAWGGLWLSLIVTAVWAERWEDRLFDPEPIERLIADGRAVSPVQAPRFVTLGFTDRRLGYYVGRPSTRVDAEMPRQAWESLVAEGVLVLVAEEWWERQDSRADFLFRERLQPTGLRYRYGPKHQWVQLMKPR